MPQIQELSLTFENLAQVDNGKVDKLLKFHMQNVSRDLMARPGDSSERKISVEFHFKPVMDDTGECECAKVEIDVKSKVPIYRTKPYEMRVVNGGVLFNRDFPDSHRQQSLLEGTENDGN